VVASEIKRAVVPKIKLHLGLSPRDDPTVSLT
jgi:hypothetical protein